MKKLEISAFIQVTEGLLVLISEPCTHELSSKSAMNMYKLCKLCWGWRIDRDHAVCQLG